MKKRDEQTYWEEECTRVYLKWYSGHTGQAYSFRRTEAVFPKLSGKVRWDFVAQQRDGRDWFALEVKQVDSKEYHDITSSWDKVIENVRTHMQHKTEGTWYCQGNCVKFPWIKLRREGRL
jgi:hypothetical protein